MWRAGRNLEVVVPVVVTAPRYRDHRSARVDEDEQRSPALVLTDVHELVAQGLLGKVVDRKDDVPEGDRGVPPSQPPGPRRSFAQQYPALDAVAAEERGQEQAHE